jgi:signal transduction histidine kinase
MRNGKPWKNGASSLEMYSINHIKHMNSTFGRNACNSLLLSNRIKCSKLEKTQSQLLVSETTASSEQLATVVARELIDPISYLQSNLGMLGTYICNLIAIIDAYEKVELSAPDRSELFTGMKELKISFELAYLKQEVVALLTESHEGIDRLKSIMQSLNDFSRINSEDK